MAYKLKKVDINSTKSYNKAIESSIDDKHQATKCSCGHNHSHNHSDTVNNKTNQSTQSSCCGTQSTLKHDHSNCCGTQSNLKHDHSNCCGIDTNRGKHTHKHSAECGCGIEHSKISYKSRWLILGICFVTLVVSFINPFENFSPYIRIIDFAWIAILICGIPIFKGAIRNIAKGRITSALLISIAICASIIMGILTIFNFAGDSHGHSENYFFAAGEIAFLMAIGALIEDLTVNKSRLAIESLLKMKPTTALKKVGDDYISVNINDIQIDDIVLVKPYELISVDGMIISGTGSVNEANITGESMPREITINDNVFAGTYNNETALIIKTTRRNEESAVSKLIEYVKKAEEKKAPIVQLADRWAKYLVPSAFAISIIVFLITFLAGAGTFDAISRAITILVVVCPCALALATPIAISAGIGNASRKGILIKNGVALERLAHIDTIALDKTGTITEGKLKVSNIFTNDISQDELLYYTASAELASEHPIAKAIVIASANSTMPTSTESIIGVGVKAMVDGHLVIVSKLNVDEYNSYAWANIHNLSATLIKVEIDGTVKGIIAINDTIKSKSKDVISKLNAMNYNTVMLTGDNELVANSVANTIGLTNYHSSLLPEDKVTKIIDIKNQGHSVLMVGDGVNDAPALAMADCSVAMSAIGNNIAMETADISLMSSDISKLPFLMKLSKKTLKAIKFNITISLTISFVAIFMSGFGLLGAVGGALIHNASSVLVCLNSARLLAYKNK